MSKRPSERESESITDNEDIYLGGLLATTVPSVLPLRCTLRHVRQAAPTRSSVGTSGFEATSVSVTFPRCVGTLLVKSMLLVTHLCASFVRPRRCSKRACVSRSTPRRAETCRWRTSTAACSTLRTTSARASWCSTCGPMPRPIPSARVCRTCARQRPTRDRQRAFGSRSPPSRSQSYSPTFLLPPVRC